MKLFSDCSGPCETCKTHYTGGCLAGHGDDDYVYASPEWIEERKALQKVRPWFENAAKHHDAYSVPQVVMVAESFGVPRSEAAALELIRLMKNDPAIYGSLFIGRVKT